MATRVSNGVPKNLARGALVLAPARGGRAWIAWAALVVAALLAGAAGSHLYWAQRLARLEAKAEAPNELPQLQHKLEQSGLMLRVAEARSQELERQIDALNQRLRECQEEVTFFRKAREGKH